MSNIHYCDECGKAFSYPNEGQVVQGFGICNNCFDELKNTEAS